MATRSAITGDTVSDNLSLSPSVEVPTSMSNDELFSEKAEFLSVPHNGPRSISLSNPNESDDYYSDRKVSQVLYEQQINV